MVEEKKEKCMEQSEEQFNIQEILFRYLIHWPWFVVSVIVCVALAWGYLRLTTPVYNISATVLIKDEKKGGGANMSSELEKMGLNGFVSSSSNIENEIEVLKSRTLAREVVSSLGLFVTYMDGSGQASADNGDRYASATCRCNGCAGQGGKKGVPETS